MAACHCARLNGREGPKAGFEICPCPPPPAKCRIARPRRLIRRVVETAEGIRLPDFHQRIANHGAGTIENAPFDANTFPFDLGAKRDSA